MEAKLCPFCNGEGEVVGLNCKYVRCKSCGATGSVKHNEGLAVQAWNKRVGADLLERMVENDLISRSSLKKMLSTFTMTITGLRAGKGVLAEFMTEYRKGVLRVVDDAPAVDALVLPVKPGDVVWILNHKFAAEIEEIRITEDGVFAVWVEFDKGPEETEVWDDGEFNIKEIGRTVFLSPGERRAEDGK